MRSTACRSTNGATHSALFGDDVRDAITPDASVARKRTPQSTHPDEVAAALAELRLWLAGGEAS